MDDDELLRLPAERAYIVERIQGFQAVIVRRDERFSEGDSNRFRTESWPLRVSRTLALRDVRTHAFELEFIKGAITEVSLEPARKKRVR